MDNWVLQKVHIGDQEDKYCSELVCKNYIHSNEFQMLIFIGFQRIYLRHFDHNAAKIVLQN